MKYLVKLENVSHKTQEFESVDAGMARDIFSDAKHSPFIVAGILSRSGGLTAGPVTLEAFRH